MNKEIKNPKAILPKGFKDSVQELIDLRNTVTETIRAECQKFGFAELETSSIEYTDVLGKFLPDKDRPSGGVFSFQDDDDQWLSMLKEQLDSGWPTVYRAYYDGGGAGHAWNVDGYSDDFLHCNWGWGGSSNGYFDINSMNGFNQDQGVIINIIPNDLNIPMALFEYTIDMMTVEFIDLSSIVNDNEIISWDWNFGDGNYSDMQSPIHNYSSYGEFIVELIVADIYGLQSEPYFESILIGEEFFKYIKAFTLVICISSEF